MALALAGAQSFDVASVKIPPPHVVGQPYNIVIGLIQNDTVTFTNASLADCIRFAYRLSSNLQLSGPEWITSAESRYNIVAKAAPGVTRAQIPQMMQALLEERFKLAFHHEQHVLDYLALITAKGGPKMPQGNDAPASAPPGIHGQLWIVSNRIPMGVVVSLLSRYMRALVVGQTGVHGEFEVKLVWTPDDRPIPDDERGPSVFAAVEEQLGLRLVSKKGPMDVLVVDGAQKIPTEN